MTNGVTSPTTSLRALDFRVSQALRKVDSPPFLGLLELTDEDRNKAYRAISASGRGNEEAVERVLRQHKNLTVWYLCDSVRRSYGLEGTARVWPDIAEALGIRSELSQRFRQALHELVAQKCMSLGLPVPPEDMVSLFRLHAGVSEAQLPALIRAFLAQERHFGLPQVDDGNSLNEWEDNALNFIPPGLSVLRMPILWDVSAWHASIYLDCRVHAEQATTTYHTKFFELLKSAESDRTVVPAPLEDIAHPKLVSENAELSIRFPDGISRHFVQFDNDHSLRVRPGAVLAIPTPLPTRVNFSAGLPPIDILPFEGDVLIGDADLDGELVQARGITQLGFVNIVMFARQPIEAKNGADVASYEIADGLFTAALTLPQTGSLELAVGKKSLTLTRKLIRRVSLKGGIIGRGSSGSLYSSKAVLMIQTGIAEEVNRKILVRFGTAYKKVFDIKTDAVGDAEISLAEIFTDTDQWCVSGPQALRVELLRPSENDRDQVIGSGVKMRADVWPDYIGRIGAQLKCSRPPENLALDQSRNLYVDQAGNACIDPDATSEIEIVFTIEGKSRRYRLPPLELNIVHIRPDGSPKPMPIGSTVVLSSDTRGGALRIQSNDRDAELEVPGRSRFQAFRGGGASTLGFRGLGSGWIRLHRTDGLTIDLAELREWFSYRSAKITKRHGSAQIDLLLETKINAVRVEIESEMGEVIVGDVYFDLEQYIARPPEWIDSRFQPDGNLNVTINGRYLDRGTWFGRLYVKADGGWQPIMSSNGALVTFVIAHGLSEPESTRTVERTKRILGWLDIKQAFESWVEGGVNAALTDRKSTLVRYLDGLAGGRAKIISMSLDNDWFVSGLTWMPSMQALVECPDMFEGPVTNFYDVGYPYRAVSLLETQRLIDLEILDPLALMGFPNAAKAQETDEKLMGFDIERLMQILLMQESFAELRWNGSPVLGATHWRSAHVLLQDRIEETGFFGEETERNYNRRSINLRLLLGLIGRSTKEQLTVPSFLSEVQKTVHQDCSQTLRRYAVAARSGQTLTWLDNLQNGSDMSRDALLRSLGDLVSLGPELFAFHLIAAELERNI